MKHIYLNKYFLFFLVIIIITGNFNNFLPYFLLIMIHEMGHAITGILLGYQLDKIVFYPYGGETRFNLPLNIPLRKELLILIMGPLMQIIGYLFLKKFFANLSLFHYTLLIFNLLPIYPLDGGRILNILCGYIFNYLKSFYLSFFISMLVISIVLIDYLVHFNLNMVIIMLILFSKLMIIYHKRFYYYNRFLLERYLYSYNFSKIKNVSNIKNFYRDRRHFIHFQNEKKVLHDYFHH